MARAYQHNYSSIKPSVFDSEPRRRKALTIVKVCQHFLETQDLSNLHLLDIGSSSGIIDDFLADHFGYVSGIDIDELAVEFAIEQFHKPNLSFARGDAMKLDHADTSVDVVVCSHVYEHVPDAAEMFAEIYRVLRPGGFCYFSGNNRVMFMEPHYRLPLLSLIPRPLAHLYMRLARKGGYYHEKHVSYWALRKLCNTFHIVDYSAKVIADPEMFEVSYMLQSDTLKWHAANFIAQYMKWATPHIWVLHKPGSALEAANAHRGS